MHSLQGRRVLVTGAAGFIGANLTRELLQRGAIVHVIIRTSTKLWRLAGIQNRIVTHPVDLTDLDRLTRAVSTIQPEFIFHSAAFGGHHSINALERRVALQDTLIGTANLLESTASLKFERFIHLGSSLEYGPKDKPLIETEVLEPSTFRGVTKAAASLLCQQTARSGGKPIVILRPFSVYGSWEPRSRLIPATMLALLRGTEMRLTSAGIRRDFVFIEDVVEACLRSAAAPVLDGEIINIGSGEQFSNEEVVALAQEVSGIRIKVSPGSFPKRPADTTNWVADIKRARLLLQWSPQYTLRAGLEKTFAWFRDHRQHYDERVGATGVR